MDGKRTGRGICAWPDGIRYEGDFVDGKFHGKGIYIWPSGALFVGDFVDGEFHGYGTLTDKNGNVLKKGRFEKGEYAGP